MQLIFCINLYYNLYLDLLNKKLRLNSLNKKLRFNNPKNNLSLII